MIQRKYKEDFTFRPQASWLPLVENRDSGKVDSQEGMSDGAAQQPFSI